MRSPDRSEDHADKESDAMTVAVHCVGSDSYRSILPNRLPGVHQPMTNLDPAKPKLERQVCSEPRPTPAMSVFGAEKSFEVITRSVVVGVTLTLYTMVVPSAVAATISSE